MKTGNLSTHFFKVEVSKISLNIKYIYMCFTTDFGFSQQRETTWNNTQNLSCLAQD